MSRFGHLHVHSEYSPLDGISRVGELVEAAKELRQPFIALTDHSRASGHRDLEIACEKHGIKAIYGAEVYYSPSVDTLKEESYHLCLFAKSQKGLENLYEMMAKSHQTFHRKAHVTLELLKQHSEGIICTSACIGGEIAQHLLQGNWEKAKSVISEFITIFKEDFYIEIQPNDIPEQLLVNKELIKIASQYDIPIIATNDVHYTYKSDAKIHEVALAMQVNKKWNDPKRFKFPTYDYWLKSEEEMMEGFISQGFKREDIQQWLDNTSLIADKCQDVKMDDKLRIPHYYDLKEGYTEKEQLAELTWKGFEEKYGSHPDKEQIRKEIEYELDVIEDTGYSGYHLIVSDFVNTARKNGIIVGDGRGSGAGCKVAYCIGITAVDPIPYGLLFERFLARGRQPDYDIDFSNQEAIFKDLQSKYGADNVTRVASYGTLSAKNVVRKVMSCFNYSMEQIKAKTSLFPDVGGSLEETYNTSEEFKAFADSIGDIYKVMQRLEGVKCNESMHAGGFLICPNITKLLPIKYELDSNGDRTIPVCLIDKKQVERTQVKFDCLGLETISVVEECLKLMRKDGIYVDLDNIDYELKEVYEILQQGDVSGIFQIANQAGKVMEQKPSNFRDLIAVNALIRPGVDYNWGEYIERRNGKSYYTHPDRQRYTRETFGLTIYQEQFLLDCQTFAGWDIAFADKNVRKNKNLANDAELMEKFIEDGIKKGYEEKVLASIWKEIVKSASEYSFNKSHATSYAVLSYKTAYLKCKYPLYWYCALLNSSIKDQDKVVEYIAECNKKNIKVLAPDLNLSEENFIIVDGAIRTPINYLKGVGTNAIKGIKQIRPIKSFDDLMERRNKTWVNKTAIIGCIKAGCFDFENPNREHMIWKYEMSQRNKTAIKNDVQLPHQDYNEKIKLKWEKEVFGMYLSKHPLTNHNPQRLEEVGEREEIVQVIEVMDIAERTQKNGKKFAFVTGSNNFGVIKCLCFADAWAESKEKFKEDDVVFIRGTRSGMNIIINEIERMII